MPVCACAPLSRAGPAWRAPKLTKSSGDELPVCACAPLSRAGPAWRAPKLTKSRKQRICICVVLLFRCTAATRTPTARLAGAKAAPSGLQADAAAGWATALRRRAAFWVGITTSARMGTASAGTAGRQGARHSEGRANRTDNVVSFATPAQRRACKLCDVVCRTRVRCTRTTPDAAHSSDMRTHRPLLLPMCAQPGQMIRAHTADPDPRSHQSCAPPSQARAQAANPRTQWPAPPQGARGHARRCSRTVKRATRLFSQGGQTTNALPENAWNFSKHGDTVSPKAAQPTAKDVRCVLTPPSLPPCCS